MGSEKDRSSEMGDAEDIPSDFFDDFAKDDFMEGLSVIDSWDDEDKTGKRGVSSRVQSESLDGVKDHRESVEDGDADKSVTDSRKPTSYVKFDDKFKWQKRDSSGPRSSSSNNPDNYIKPGSRRDPSKTNEAIKKDKEVKVKEYLAKHLDSADDLRPPGTELDDYYDEDKSKDRKRTPKHVEEDEFEHPPERRALPRHHYKDGPHYKDEPHYKDDHHHPSPHRPSPRRRRSPRWSPHHMPRRSPHRQFRRFSPPPHKFFKRRYSPQRRSPHRRSPQRRSPRRYSPMRHRAYSPRRRRSSRSPYRLEHRPANYEYDMQRSRSPRSRSPRRTDTFLYPADPNSTPVSFPPETYLPEPSQIYNTGQNEYPGNVPGYSYPQNVQYSNSYTAGYDYTVPPVPPTNVLPGPTPMPILNPVPAPVLDPVAAPAMVPAPTVPVLEQKTPYDALAQLVAEGKISQEDYLKLAPNKGASSSLESKVMTGVMTRCNQALTKLEKLVLPSHLMMNNHIFDSELKSAESKYRSPLKRQADIEFNFTKTYGPTVALQNKQLVEAIVSTIGLDKLVSKKKKSLPKDMKDAACQTSKPYCDVCEIRESTKVHEADTTTDPKYFTSTVHTQVEEQDLVNSKTVFNPSGSVADGAPISIAHLTPAQLVSQLAARAKTLQQPTPAPPVHQNQFGRRNPNYDYDGRGGGPQYHHNYNNYRY